MKRLHNIATTTKQRQQQKLGYGNEVNERGLVVLVFLSFFLHLFVFSKALGKRSNVHMCCEVVFIKLCDLELSGFDRQLIKETLERCFAFHVQSQRIKVKGMKKHSLGRERERLG